MTPYTNNGEKKYTKETNIPVNGRGVIVKKD